MRRAVIIYNPAAGRLPPAFSPIERAIPVLERAGWRVRLEQSQSASHVTDIARQAASEGIDAVFVAGGDGSLNLAVAGLMDSQTALGVLPIGTANVWAQELGLPTPSWTYWTAPEDSAARLANALTHSVDIGLCNSRPFLLWAGIGLDAYVVHQLEPRSRWEKNLASVGYAASTLWNASQYHGADMTITADGRKIRGHFILAVMSNIHLYAGGLAELSPQARLDDNWMELWLFKGESFTDTVQRAWDLFAGQHIDSSQVMCIPFQSVTLETDSVLYIQTDGEPVSENRCVTVEVRHHSLRALIPEDVPHPLFVGNP